MDNLDIINGLWDYGNPKVTREKFREYLANNSIDKSLELELETQIIRTYSLEGKYNEAFRLCDMLETRIPGNSSAYLRFLLEKGRIFNSSGEKEQALKYFKNAAKKGKLLRDDYLTVDALHMIAIADNENSLDHNLIAIEYAENSEDKRARGWLGSLLNNTGWIYHDEEEYSEALKLFEKAQKFFKENKKNEQERIARWTVARCLRSMNRVDEALKMQLALLTELEELGEQDGFCHEELGELMLQKGREHHAKKHFAKAYELLKDISWIEKDRLERMKSLSI